MAKQQPAGLIRETAACQDRWQSDNQLTQARHNKRGGSAMREVAVQGERCRRGRRGTGMAREAAMQQPTAGVRVAQ